MTEIIHSYINGDIIHVVKLMTFCGSAKEGSLVFPFGPHDIGVIVAIYVTPGLHCYVGVNSEELKCLNFCVSIG